MYLRLALLSAWLLSLQLCLAQISSTQLRTENRFNPVGIGAQQARLSWIIQSQRPNTMQTAYQIRVGLTSAEVKRGRHLIWDSKKVHSDVSHLVPYQGPTLQSRQRYYWQVKIWDNQGIESSWSEPAYWEMALLKELDWKAKWISADWPEDTSQSQPVHQYRTEFSVRNRVQQARLYITSYGLYQARINGQKVGNQELSPGWTSYPNRLQYQTYDVTDLVQSGGNALAVELGDGWYRGWLGWSNTRNQYGKELALLAQLEITYRDGRMERVLSDENWKAHPSPILISDLYNGEVYDAQKQSFGWEYISFDDSQWSSVRIKDLGYKNLIAPQAPPVRKIQEITPRELIITPKGEMVVDMGQNMVGWIRFKTHGRAGQTITFSHAEVLDQDGNFYTDNLRSAKQRVTYTFAQNEEIIFEPHFTFMGFRYVKVEGWTGELRLDQIIGIVLHSDLARTGSFSCSDSLLNQLQHNIQWGQKGNFVDVPTDCPQRDERMGWTGDAQVFFSTAAFNYDVSGFFRKWLADVSADQTEDGRIPFVVPNVLGEGAAGATGWADAGTIIPWQYYVRYGDTAILEKQYPSMEKWVEYMRKEAGEDYLWNTGFHFGDWLSYNPPGDLMGQSALTYKPLLQQAFFAHSTWILQQAASVLGKTQAAEKYALLLQNIRNAFMNEYLTPSGRLVSETQTAYVVALQFDLLPENQRVQTAALLAENVRRYGHLTTGFLGTPYLCFVLSRFGYTDLAYQLLCRKEYPSWLYPVSKGATTIWERWDGIQPNGEFQDAGMNSFNHYAYGAIGDWMYRVVCGLNPDPDQPGYKHIILKPMPGGELNQARVEYQTAYGLAVSGWKIIGQQIHFEIKVPANTMATLYLPNAAGKTILSNNAPLKTGQGINLTAEDGNMHRLTLGSGEFNFSYIWE